ncbi:adenosylcobinamide-phosphate synthase CbiB [Flavobacterium sp. 7A]|uniref:adenosylcobinamide-phosphate synthase CbiB n=1 Tax=Flavobacterium sp. 7A TaxID=2940571 RepID=UPI0022265EFD|nr:adenosylcobinamide-phosphate synthase CbiB [Flavobacterium sp. 7A]MCW2119670.1 adenosylcobinamide-phosphate synthase [Flavobacterium sp. 7A]
MELMIVLLVGYVLDLIFGDPRGIPHLIVGFGNLISWSEKKWNNGNKQFLKGMGCTLFCVGLVWGASLLLSFVCTYFEIKVVYFIISIILLYYCLANKTLVTEGKSVFNALKKDGIEAGRKRLSWIVGRDTSKLTAQQIRKATFETMSENLSDGVIAPLFYFIFFGITGALVYKMINTLDSMIGYKSERYEQFGKFSAKLDDVANYIPSRLTAVLMLLVTGKLKGLSVVFTQGKNHSSPNAGYPEAALAYILSCQFGGPNVYHGQLVYKPFIGENDRKLEHHEIQFVAAINYRVAFIFVFFGALYLFSI